EVAVRLNGLDPASVCVECVFGDEDEEGNYVKSASHRLEPAGSLDAAPPPSLTTSLHNHSMQPVSNG
ncbi:MAG: hypothetical protein ACRESO_06680, partial [Gammaproteobacteria bacterium]